MQSQIAGLSPEIAASMGAPLDPTAGFDFAEGARPTDLPQPGDTPGGVPTTKPTMAAGGEMQGMMAAFQGAGPLPDDHAALLGDAHSQPVPPQPPGPGGPPVSRQGPQAPGVQAGEPLPDHPTLTALRLDLGIDEIQTVDVDIGGHKWTLSLLPADGLATVNRLVDMISETITERSVVFEAAVAANAVVAIDSSPTYMVFGIQVPPAVTIKDHLRPPSPIRRLATARLFDFIFEKSRTQLGSKIYEAYVEKIDQAAAVTSALDDTPRVRYKCPEELCGHELFIAPRFRAGTRDQLLPFCQWHAVPMVILKAEVGDASPLA